VYGGAWLGLCAGVAVLGAGVQLVDPDFIARALDSITAAVTVGSASAPLVVMRPFGGSPLGIAAIVVTLLGYAILVASLVWAVAAWGAFRQSFGATRLQSWLATSLWLACLAALVGLALRLG
jgi:hypothetical protein